MQRDDGALGSGEAQERGAERDPLGCNIRSRVAWLMRTDLAQRTEQPEEALPPPVDPDRFPHHDAVQPRAEAAWIAK